MGLTGANTNQVREMGNTIAISVKVDAELLHDLEVYAINHRLNRSQVIREAIINLLESEGQKDRRKASGRKAKIESLGRLK